ncbi:MAG TPA: Pycsar system effector family protein [Acidimicrobiales bacterium]|nr:Pycsar system effector family protein [Acidimicrobiales bacterium]
MAGYAGHWLWSTSTTRSAEFDAALAAAATDAGTDRRLEDQIWFLGCSAYRKYKLIAWSMWIFAAALICGGVAIVFEVWP